MINFLTARQIGSDDISWGTGSLVYTDVNGVTHTIPQVNATQIPTTFGQTVDEALTSLTFTTVVNVKDYGAVGNGTTDDTAAINAAHATGQQVFYPVGVYKYVGNLTVLEGAMLGSGWGTSGGATSSIIKFYNCTDTSIGAINTRAITWPGNFFRIENISIQASSWNAVTGCLGYGIDAEAPIIMRNVLVGGFKKSNIWFHHNAAGNNGPYQSMFNSVRSEYSGQHGCLIGNGGNAITLINYQGKWNGATVFNTAPAIAGNYDGLLVDATADGGVYPLYVPAAISVVGGDCSYNSRYGWYLKGLQYSNVNPGYAEGNLRAGGYQGAVGSDIQHCSVNFAVATPATIEVVAPFAAYAENLQLWAGGTPVIYYRDYSLSQRGVCYLSQDGSGNDVIMNPTNAAGSLVISPFGQGSLEIGTGSQGTLSFGAVGSGFLGLPIAYYKAIKGAVNITGAVNNGGGLIRLTVDTDIIETDRRIYVSGVVGVPAANGVWFVTRTAANTIDLIGSTFAGTYVSGGKAQCVAWVTHSTNSYPTTGTSAVDDTHWNMEPSASGGANPNAGWICVVAGANPGTAKFAPIALGAAVP